jgi:hypothetical protein
VSGSRIEQAERAALAASVALNDAQAALEGYKNGTATDALIGGDAAVDSAHLAALVGAYHIARTNFRRTHDALKAARSETEDA